jgi:regulator of protease activity HflC (stomatin/prohibitin superfamily)
MIIVFGFFMILLMVVLLSSIRVVPQSSAYIIERLGTYSATWDTGLHIKVPLIERVVKRISLKEQVVDFAPFGVITKDNVTIKVDTITFYQITDAKLFAYGVNDPIRAIELLTNTILRDEFGKMELDASLTSRDAINSLITQKLDKATDAWGIKVNRVEVKNMIPPKDIQEAMEKQMRAERERREAILRAEGEKKSLILKAEGEKESLLLKAQADKEAVILKAQADKEAAILQAEAIKEAKIREAEGEFEAIMKTRQAEASAYSMLKETLSEEDIVKIRGFEALEKVADGNGTKVIIPSDLQSVAGTLIGLKESLDNK